MTPETRDLLDRIKLDPAAVIGATPMATAANVALLAAVREELMAARDTGAAVFSAANDDVLAFAAGVAFGARDLTRGLPAITVARAEPSDG
jgi:hypothetical protein